jgi:hypothetical protein
MSNELKFHPLADIFPLMEGPEFDELVADIKTNGLRGDIVLFDGMILDGRNRYRACIEAGIPPPATHDGNKHISDPAAYVVSANLHRRHLTQEQKRDLIAKLVKAQPEKSDRQIAKAAKVDHKTVGAARSALEATGEIPQLRETTGADGKSRKRTKRKVAREADEPRGPPIATDVVAEAIELVSHMTCQQRQRFIYLLDVNEWLPVKGTKDGDAIIEAGRQQVSASEQHDPFDVPPFLVRKPGLAS